MTKRLILAGAALVVVLAVLAGVYRFGKRSAEPSEPPPATGGEPTTTLSAVVRLQPIESRVTGTVSFTEPVEGGGVAARYSLRNVPPGEHALHVHENGDCTASDGSSIGALFASGDLGSLAVNETRFARGDRVHPELPGVAALSGRAVVVHERAGPSEDAVGRPIACGVVMVRPARR